MSGTKALRVVVAWPWCMGRQDGTPLPDNNDPLGMGSALDGFSYSEENLT